VNTVIQVLTEYSRSTLAAGGALIGLVVFCRMAFGLRRARVEIDRLEELLEEVRQGTNAAQGTFPQVARASTAPSLAATILLCAFMGCLLLTPFLFALDNQTASRSRADRALNSLRIRTAEQEQRFAEQLEQKAHETESLRTSVAQFTALLTNLENQLVIAQGDLATQTQESERYGKEVLELTRSKADALKRWNVLSEEAKRLKMALTNQITKVAPQPAETPAPPAPLDPVAFQAKQAKLNELLELYRSEQITPFEYHQRRNRVLAEP
jgi:hypothetical protein